ncbi:preprotein translocase subunit SecE [Marinobacter sp. M3C]|jgi:preprotein translocase subunit SecE|uniref:preprotein translocase subunit SecE n=1 Tax=unclassified Marinobacter TaxID=83889 RepID=UPI000BF3E5FD|nr:MULTISPECIES: preprotein translocase subunit SecE [unclassified Marinobacter]MCL1476470.1 preprotein translocase subunit SecE [Marinobacter sp.]MCL1480967.1 preprotein translocase subunit SecE [Marinobacter sp.]MCL1483623.1 preprotein translocase subunit SecE [Marinobacter sp.]MCL1486624.1 preprotein translocase subunit SecE [Marinobacter sp.]PFG09980.1 preprotein translocase subunit SecE [Marinobacter sp. LV10MA510-1]
MESRSVQSSSRLDVVKWLVVFLLVTVGVVGNQYFAAESLLYRVIALVVLAAIAAFIAVQTSRGGRFAALLKEARVEIRKVVWPTRPELIQTTAIVIVFVLVVALLLWVMDSLISLLVAGFIG